MECSAQVPCVAASFCAQQLPSGTAEAVATAEAGALCRLPLAAGGARVRGLRHGSPQDLPHLLLQLVRTPPGTFAQQSGLNDKDYVFSSSPVFQWLVLLVPGSTSTGSPSAPSACHRSTTSRGARRARCPPTSTLRQTPWSRWRGSAARAAPTTSRCETPTALSFPVRPYFLHTSFLTAHPQPGGALKQGGSSALHIVVAVV